MSKPYSASRVPAIALCLALLFTLTTAPSRAAADKAWNYLPANEIGAEAFRAAHPAWDGRGVVIAILDTGVDAFAPGMLTTSTGMTKLIDVRDFSTEGDWETALAELDSSGTAAAPVYRTAGGLRLRGAAALPVAPVASEPVYIGEIREKDFVNNADVYDLNDDGDNTDRFGFLVYAADRAAVEEALGVGAGYEMLMGLNDVAKKTVATARLSRRVWVVAVDTDGNGDLADEVLLRDYRVNYDAFVLTDDNSPDARGLMAWEVNVVANEDHLGAPEAPTVEFHFDDGSHGSHCAGIAAGFEVSGQEGMHGAAPGAWVISLKLGDNRLSGGATRTSSMKKAYEYAASFEEKYGIPVVVNMSFGIDSVEEGEDAMGLWLNDMLAEHPTLYVCTSAGNSGPGLSTVGLPATAYSLISSGAYLSPATGADLYDARMEQATLFNFSSRGGEAAKPDVVAPGSALSTVPGFVDGSARYNGTSMASPQTAGAVACLVGAARQEGLSIHWGMVKRALIAGGTPVPGLTLNDQGGGLVTMQSTWEVLQKQARSESAHDVLWYDIETACAFQADGMSDAAYWRTPGGAPFAPENVTFTVTPVFHPDLSPDEKDTFFRSFNFKSEAPWLKVVSGDRYLRGDMGLDVVCQYDGGKLTAPGAYAARVIGGLDGGDLSGLAGREFYLWNTVVVGDPVGPVNGYRKVYQGKGLVQSSVHRYYVDVPAGASAMRVRLEVSEDTGSSRGSRVLTEICDPEGKVRGGFAGYATVDGGRIKDQTVLTPELYPGTWEINVASSINAMDQSDYRLSVSFDGYEAEPGTVAALERAAAGQNASGSLTVTRSFAGVFQGTAQVAIEGFAGQEAVSVEEKDEYRREFTLDGTTPRADFHLKMDETTGNLFTDCAVNILDAQGKAVVIDAFSGLEADVGLSLPAGQADGTYTLQVVGAFALAADKAAWGFDLEEKFSFAEPVAGKVERAGGGPLRLYCGVPTELELSFDAAWPAPPAKMKAYGAVHLMDTNTADRRPGDDGGRLVLAVPLLLD